MRQTTTNFTGTDSITRAATLAYPEQLVFAESAKCPVEASIAVAGGYPVALADILLVVSEYGTVNQYSEVRVTDRTGSASFDIARYVQMLLGDTDQLGTFDYSGESEVVPQKLIQVKLSAFGADIYTITFNAVHGNNKLTDRWWSKPRKIRWWPAYPFAIDLPNQEMNVIDEHGVASFIPDAQTLLSYTRVRVNLAEVSSYQINMMRTVKGGILFGIAGSSDTGHVAGTKLFRTDDYNIVNFIADKCPADQNAAYLRWLDRHCELRHWLFSKYRENDTVKATEDRRAGFDPDIITDGVLQDGRLWDGTKTKELTVNTGYLQGWEYDLVESIINAPFVDMLDMDEYLADGTIIWHRLTVKPGSYTRQLRNAHSTDHNHQLAVTLQYDGERSVGV